MKKNMTSEESKSILKIDLIKFILKYYDNDDIDIAYLSF